MQFTPDSSIQEERLLLVEKMSADEILTKVTGREEVDLYLPSNPQLSSSASFLRLNVLSSLN